MFIKRTRYFITQRVCRRKFLKKVERRVTQYDTVSQMLSQVKLLCSLLEHMWSSIHRSLIFKDTWCSTDFQVVIYKITLRLPNVAQIHSTWTHKTTFSHRKAFFFFSLTHANARLLSSCFLSVHENVKISSQLCNIPIHVKWRWVRGCVLG